MQAISKNLNFTELEMLWQITKVLNEAASPQELGHVLEKEFKNFFKIETLKIWIYDENTETIRDFTKNWYIIDNKAERKHLFNTFEALSQTAGECFMINNALIQFGTQRKELLERVQQILVSGKGTFVLPITDRNIVVGFMELINPDLRLKDCVNLLLSLNITATQVSTVILNLKLKEQMLISIAFHKAMKDIAKLIESQYELNYIIPLIGEMIDRFIPEHLIYIFKKNKEEDKYELLWPSSYSTGRLNPIMEKITETSGHIISDDKCIGVFPIITNGEISGTVVADGKTHKLTEREISYLERLTHQSAITIEKANTYAEVLKQATVDALTGLYNRHQFDLRLNQEFSIAQRKKVPLCCIMLDIDFFKSINDNYGHPVGDRVIIGLAQAIKSEIRTYDIAARYGGEEFCIILPHTQIKKAEIIANRLREKIEETLFDISNITNTDVKNISITVSMGISEYKSDFTDARRLYEEADIALYKAKQTGRNRVVLFNELS